MTDFHDAAMNTDSDEASDGSSAGSEEEVDPNRDFATFRWEVPDFRSVTEKKIYSPVFESKTQKWRIMLFPRGNANDRTVMSLYLAAYEEEGDAENWSTFCEFALYCVNQRDERKSFRRPAHHRFRKGAADWGFTSFMRHTALFDPNAGYMVDGKVIVEVELEVSEGDDDTTDYFNYDSRKETGYVGLTNQGATCYMNSLLQTLHHIPYFRKSVYALPTMDDDPETSIPLALQRVFYRLQYDDESVSTTELTKSFGWDSLESFMQHDVQELNRVLMDNLETKMKGTPVEGTINRLWEGKMVNYISCVNVDYESTREESFYDISLNVKGLKNIYEAFDDYVRPELLEGENQYRTEDFGLQDARKGVRFQSLPPVLYIQLKRFEYDFMRDVNVKINDKFEFPTTLELDPYLTDDADRSFHNTYDLHAVLVHSGDVHGGHYYAFDRPTTDEKWYKFDDDRVTAATEKVAVTDNFGHKPEKERARTGMRRWPLSRGLRTLSRCTSAYMLMYIRRSDSHWVMAPIQEEEVPEHLKERFQLEKVQEEQRLKERMEAHLYINLKIATGADFRLHDDFDLVDFKKGIERVFKVKKVTPLAEVMDEIAEATGVATHRMRLWKWVSRQNKTCRPQNIVSPSKYEQPVVSLFKNPLDCKLWLEESALPADAPADSEFFPPHTKEDMMLFFKRFNPLAPEGEPKMVFAGNHAFKQTQTLEDVMPIMNEFAGNAPDAPILVMEEIKPDMIDPVAPGRTLAECELQNGDILCFMDPITDEQKAQCQFPDIVSYYNYLRVRVIVEIRSLTNPSDEPFKLELLKSMKYDEVAEKVGAAANVEAANIRFTAHNSYTDAPKAFPHRRVNALTGVQVSLKDMLQNFYGRSKNVLYYEVLEMSLADYENKLRRNIYWYNDKVEEQFFETLFIDKTSTINELLEIMREKVLAHEGNENDIDAETPLRLIEVNQFRITKVFNPNDKITLLSEHTHLRCEAIPEDQRELEKSDKLVYSIHFHKDVFHPYGDPFLCLVRDGETLAEIKARVKATLEIDDEEFETWRFAIVSFGRPEYLEDDAPIRTKDIWPTDCLGLDHADKRPNSKKKKHGNSRMTNPAVHHREHAIKIYN